MKNLTLIILGFALFIGCSEKRERKVNGLISSFDLEKDIYNFSEKMNNGDTLILKARLGVCTSNCHEHNLIYKINDKIYIQSVIEDIDYGEDKSKILERTPYEYKRNDSLNFENLFSKQKNNRIKPKDNGDYTFVVINKTDTIVYRGENLIVTLGLIKHYSLIKERIYPNEKIFQPVRVPVD